MQFNSMLTAVGVGIDPRPDQYCAERPLLAQSTDGGNTWAVKTPTKWPGLLDETSCTDSDPTAICIAVGWGYTNDWCVNDTPPLLVASTELANNKQIHNLLKKKWSF